MAGQQPEAPPDTLSRGGDTFKARRDPEEQHPSTEQRSWLRRARQGRAASGSAGRRRAPDSWTRSASSLEETRRRGARAPSGVTWPPRPSSLLLAAGPTKTLWCTSSGASFPLLLLNPGGGTSWVWPRRRVPRAQSRRSGDAGTKARCPDSSAWEKPSPVHPQNAGAPSSEDQSTDPPQMGPEGKAGEEALPVEDSPAAP